MSIAAAEPINPPVNNMADRPKRPLSGYMIWLGDHREQIKSENPGIKVTEIAKKGGELWRALKDKSVSVPLCVAGFFGRGTRGETKIVCLAVLACVYVIIYLTDQHRNLSFHDTDLGAEGG